MTWSISRRNGEKERKLRTHLHPNITVKIENTGANVIHTSDRKGVSPINIEKSQRSKATSQFDRVTDRTRSNITRRKEKEKRTIRRGRDLLLSEKRQISSGKDSFFIIDRYWPSVKTNKHQSRVYRSFSFFYRGFSRLIVLSVCRRRRSCDKRSQACWIFIKIVWARCFSSESYRKRQKFGIAIRFFSSLRLFVRDIGQDAIAVTKFDTVFRYLSERRSSADAEPKGQETMRVLLIKVSRLFIVIVIGRLIQTTHVRFVSILLR